MKAKTQLIQIRKGVQHKVLRILLIGFGIYGITVSYSQPLNLTSDTLPHNFYELRVTMEEKWKHKEGECFSLHEKIQEQLRTGNQKENEYIHFKRWENFVEPRVYPSGDLGLLSSTYFNFKTYEKKYKNRLRAMRQNAVNWSFVGPPGNHIDGRNGGRMNIIRFDPANPSIIYAGAPAGGVWKTIDGGTTWIPLTDFLPLIGCSDIAISPTNTSVLYMGSGDSDGGDTQSIGVFKSTNAGLTWELTSLQWPKRIGTQISRVLVHPANPNIVWCFTRYSAFKTTNGGVTWNEILQYGNFGDIRDAELHPTNPDIIYFVSNEFYRSTNGGNSFTKIIDIPITNNRSCIAVTPANPNYVYVLKSADNGDMFGLYRSENAGATFTRRSNTPNILGYNENFGSGNQTWYDMGMAVNTVNPDLVIACGVRNFRSEDGGRTWTVATADCYRSDLEMHWDIHDLAFVPGSLTNAFAANDGGIYKTVNTGNCWSSVNHNNVAVNQIYGFGISATDPEVMISGHQDGATIVHNNGTYRDVIGGDGFEAFIDRTNQDIMYGQVYFGNFRRSNDGGLNWVSLVDNSGIIGRGPWSTKWLQDPVDAATIWAGYGTIFKSQNYGTTWTRAAVLPTEEYIVDFCVAPSNNQVIYVVKNRALYVSRNGGNSWTDRSIILDNFPAAVSSVSVHDANENHIWITFSGYVDGVKVIRSLDGGNTWQNISNGLPNVSVNCSGIVPGSAAEDIYIGADIGVYFYNNNQASWVPYFNELPHAPVSDIEFFMPQREIRVSTYGRGIWKTNLLDPIGLDLSDSDANEDEDTFSPVAENKMLVFPNPAVQSTLKVVIRGVLKSARLYDLDGRLVQVLSLNEEGLMTIDTIPAGVYILEVKSTDGKIYTERIIKK
ncbi:MAG: T9SS type A sorting domain-containing protein [Cytophagaceae bacterium]|nr:T9SS type A sorting domain-containing protein [Cytophagaceae bacterium]